MKGEVAILLDEMVLPWDLRAAVTYPSSFWGDPFTTGASLGPAIW